MLIVICTSIFVYFFLFYHFWNMVSLYCLAQAARTFVVLLSLPLSTGITGQHSQTQIKNILIYIWKNQSSWLWRCSVDGGEMKGRQREGTAVWYPVTEWNIDLGVTMVILQRCSWYLHSVDLMNESTLQTMVGLIQAVEKFLQSQVF